MIQIIIHLRLDNPGHYAMALITILLKSSNLKVPGLNLSHRVKIVDLFLTQELLLIINF